MTGLLLLSVVLSATPSAAAAAPSTAVSSQMQVAQSQPAAQPATSTNPLNIRSSGDICYKIRAYIFKRDDDHAPKMVGSTTCPAQRPRARSTEGLIPHLEPATVK